MNAPTAIKSRIVARTEAVRLSNHSITLLDADALLRGEQAWGYREIDSLGHVILFRCLGRRDYSLEGTANLFGLASVVRKARRDHVDFCAGAIGSSASTAVPGAAS